MCHPWFMKVAHKFESLESLLLLLLLVSLLNLGGNEASSSRRNVEYDLEDSFDELMTYPTSLSRVGNEEDDVAFYLDEEDLDE
ncbi:hypothetical protein DVH24_021381 [Malus domestica]|uniref:Uncharacterized protein n=1 Tax=Malus domestica TaxID=3750 RepID=A0A498JUL9_MALDO|nr:hypothetical protein DVH24_021381 [Malus domestica]